MCVSILETGSDEKDAPGRHHSDLAASQPQCSQGKTQTMQGTQASKKGQVIVQLEACLPSGLQEAGTAFDTLTEQDSA